MADRILTWHRHITKHNETRIGPAFYMEADYEVVAVRIHSETAPTSGDVEVDILDDGVSIFSNRASSFSTPSSQKGVVGTSNPVRTTAILLKGETTEIDAEDFNQNPIEIGSWVTCSIEKRDTCENLTVHLELLKVSENDEVED